MRRWQLSKRDKKDLLASLKLRYGEMGGLLSRLKDSRVEKLVENDMVLYLVDGKAAFIELDSGLIIPHLLLLLDRGYSWLPYIVVDEGAVMPISRGADLMRPGVLEFHGNYRQGDIIVIVDPNHRLPLAVHQALIGRVEAEALQKGRISKSLHHVGDKYWKLAKSI
jgi:PUA-domain protein